VVGFFNWHFEELAQKGDEKDAGKCGDTGDIVAGSSNPYAPKNRVT
jgi:hypothetical protein